MVQEEALEMSDAVAQPRVVLVPTRRYGRKARPFFSAWVIWAALVVMTLLRSALPGELGRRTVLTRPFKWMFWNAASLALGTFMPEHRPCALARDRNGPRLPYLAERLPTPQHDEHAVTGHRCGAAPARSLGSPRAEVFRGPT